MAMYRCEAKIFSREKRGRSIIAAAAYRAAAILKDERSGTVYDYSRRTKGIVDTQILAPEGAPDWVLDSEALWNAVEAGEKRVDAQLSREFILAVPPELDSQAQFAAALGWAQSELVARGMVAELSLHQPKSGKNPHVHVLTTLRKWEGDGFSAKKPREWNEVSLLVHWRQSWCDAVNAALEQAGCPERVDHRSLKDRGIDQVPQPKIGPVATARKRRGIEADPEQFRVVRWVKALNDLRPLAKAIRQHGEVRQMGMGDTWWERSIVFMGRLRDQAEGLMRKTWRKMFDRGGAKEESNGPEITR